MIPILVGHQSLSTSIHCWPDLYWTGTIGGFCSVANNHTLAIYVYLLASLFYLGNACVICLHMTCTHSLSILLFVVPFSFTHSFCTLTLSPSHALDIFQLRYSLRSIAYRFIEKSNFTKFDQVRGEKYLHLERQTYITR